MRANLASVDRGRLRNVHIEGDRLTERDAIQERRRRTKEYGYRVCGLWDGGVLDGHPRICVMPRGHEASPHRDADREDLALP